MAAEEPRQASAAAPAPADPVMNRLSPGVRYAFHMVPVVKPFLGAVYRHTFVADFDDTDALGGRGGVYFAPPRARIYAGGGAVYERVLECSSNLLVDCDEVYPEIFFGIAL